MAEAPADPGQSDLDEQYKALESQFGLDFMTYHPDAESTIQFPPEIAADVAGLEPDALRRFFAYKVQALRDGEILDVSFPIGLLSLITREEIAALEAEGLVLSGVEASHPSGGTFLKNRVSSSLSPDDKPVDPTDTNIKAIFASGLLRPVTGLVTVQPSGGIPEKLEGLPRIPVNCLVAAVYNDGKWSQTAVLPDGNWVVPGFDNTTFQYAQGVFEGGVASDGGEVKSGSMETGNGTISKVELVVEAEVDQHGKITIFRPEENARRMAKSCTKMDIPPISVDQYVQAVIAAVKNNMKFIPMGGKLYIRSFMVGLRGGTGVKPAKQYLFAVEVSPYGEYMSKSAPANAEQPEVGKKLTLKGVVSPRNPDTGGDKAITNYGPILRARREAQANGFADIVLLDGEGFVQECASNNLFVVNKLGEGKFCISTPPLIFHQLPGITRKSLLEVLRDPTIIQRLGYQIELNDVDPIREDKLTQSDTDGLFSTGTAAGITAFDEYESSDQFNGGTVQTREYNDPETKEFITALSQLLKDLRQGEVLGYENWAMVVE